MGIEAVMFWNEPNNLSHWDFEIDPEWKTFGRMVRLAGEAVRAVRPQVTRVLGGISPIDPEFVTTMIREKAVEEVDVIAVHGFPLDWNHWPITEWPAQLEAIAARTSLPVWVTEAGASSFGAEEVQEFGLRTSARLLIGRTPRIHRYSLFDLPRTWPATTRHRKPADSSYYRHFHMGLVREDGTPKRALQIFADFTPQLGLCQWFHFEDPRLEEAIRLFKALGVRHVRTGLSWADSFRPGAAAWFDRQMRALESFQVTLTYCFTPDQRGVRAHHTSPPQNIEEFAEFCATMTARYA